MIVCTNMCIGDKKPHHRFYMLISLIGIYLISSISQNIVRLFHASDKDKKDDPNRSQTEA